MTIQTKPQNIDPKKFAELVSRINPSRVCSSTAHTGAAPAKAQSGGDSMKTTTTTRTQPAAPSMVPEVGVSYAAGQWIEVRTARRTYFGRFLWCNEQLDGVVRLGIKDGAGWWVIDLADVVDHNRTTKSHATRHLQSTPDPTAHQRKFRRPQLAFAA